MRHTIFALVLAACALAPHAEAAPVTQSLSFTASGFGAGAPTDPVTGSLTFTYDPAVPNVLRAVDSLSMIIGGTTYVAADVVAASNAVVGNDCVPGRCSISDATPGFAMAFRDWATPQIALFGFSYSVGTGQVFLARQFSTSLQPTAVPAHLPLAMTGLLVLGIGALGRRGANGRPA
jgi:hypothetical protein